MKWLADWQWLNHSVPVGSYGSECWLLCCRNTLRHFHFIFVRDSDLSQLGKTNEQPGLRMLSGITTSQWRSHHFYPHILLPMSLWQLLGCLSVAITLFCFVLFFISKWEVAAIKLDWKGLLDSCVWIQSHKYLHPLEMYTLFFCIYYQCTAFIWALFSRFGLSFVLLKKHISMQLQWLAVSGIWQ